MQSPKSRNTESIPSVYEISYKSKTRSRWLPPPSNFTGILMGGRLRLLKSLLMMFILLHPYRPHPPSTPTITSPSNPVISPSLQPYRLSLTHLLLVRTKMYTSPVSTWLLTNTLLRGRRTNRIKQGDLMKIRRNQRDEDRDTVWVCKLWPGR